MLQSVVGRPADSSPQRAYTTEALWDQPELRRCMHRCIHTVGSGAHILKDPLESRASSTALSLTLLDHTVYNWSECERAPT